MSLIHNMKFLNSAYLSVALQSKVLCFIVGLSKWGPMLASSILNLAPTSALPIATACTADFMASMAVYVVVFVIAFVSPFSVCILLSLSISKTLVCTFFLVLILILCNVTCLSEGNTSWL